MFFSTSKVLDSRRNDKRRHSLLRGGDSTKSLNINLLQNGIDISSSNVGRYSFSCVPEEADSAFVPVDKASCAFSIKSVKTTDVGRYTCRVQSLQQGQTKTKQAELRIFGECFFHVGRICLHRAFRVDKFILAPTNNQKEITLSTSEPFSLSCRINQQKYTADLNVEWRRSGYAVGSRKVSNTLDNPFTYAVSSAQQSNAGVYRCVIRSVNDGDVVIDSGNSTTVNIKCKRIFAYFIVNFFLRSYFIAVSLVNPIYCSQ